MNVYVPDVNGVPDSSPVVALRLNPPGTPISSKTT